MERRAVTIAAIYECVERFIEGYPELAGKRVQVRQFLIDCHVNRDIPIDYSDDSLDFTIPEKGAFRGTLAEFAR